MPRTVQALVGLYGLLLVGCPGSIDNPAPFRNAVRACPSDFNVEERIFRRTCGQLACHQGGSALAAAGLDLASPNVGERLLAHTSTSTECAGEPMLDPANYRNSLFLDMLQPEPRCSDDSMPVGGAPLNAQERGCLDAYLTDLLGIELGDAGTAPLTDGGSPMPRPDAGMPQMDSGMMMQRQPVTIQAESMMLTTYAADSGNYDGFIRIPTGQTNGTATATFNGVPGSYQLRVVVLAEPDGRPQLRVRVGNMEVANETFPMVAAEQRDTVLGPWTVNLTAGATITLEGTANEGAWARVDRVELMP